MYAHQIYFFIYVLLNTKSDERGVSGLGSIPVAILCSCQDTKSVCVMIA